MNRRAINHRDRGTILPLVLVVVVVLGAVIVALADYSSSTLRYGQTVERSSDRLASANGAIDNVLEAIERSSSLCTLSTLAGQPGGYEFALGDQLNDIEPTVRCETLGGGITGLEEFAIVLTGGVTPGNGITDHLLDILPLANSTPKNIDGPVYMAEPPVDGVTIRSQAASTIQNGDLWYSTTGTCPASGVSLPASLSILPAGYGLRCVEEDYATLFASAQPAIPSLAGLPLNPTPTDIAGCAVWPEGRYDTPPDLTGSDYHYFQSGTYHFDDFGRWEITGAWALFGSHNSQPPAIAGPDTIDTLGSNPCLVQWATDAQTGASIYMSGSSHVEILNRGALEVSGREQGAAQQVVAVQTFNTTVINNEPRLIRMLQGNNRQLALRGLIWAPDSSLRFESITNESVAALTGGAVLGELHLGAPASASNFLIRAGGTPLERQLEITATAASPEGGVTEVRARIEYANSEYGLLSRRVRCLTPGESGC